MATLASYLSNAPTGNGSVNFGNTSTTQQQAQQFTVSSSGLIGSVTVYLQKVASPSDACVVSIYTDSGGNPGTLIETGSNVTGDASWSAKTSTFSGTNTLNTSTTYWLVMSRSGTLND